MDLKAHLENQIIFSRNTFGPGTNTERLLNHLKNEIEEVEQDFNL